MDVFAEFRGRIDAILERKIAEGQLPLALDRSRFTVEPPRDPEPWRPCDQRGHGLRQGSAGALQITARLRHRACGCAGRGPGCRERRGCRPWLPEPPARSRMSGQVCCGRPFRLEIGLADPSIATVDGPVNVEFVSANPTGPMHVGHGRGAVFGDALANLLQFAGQSVTREYYINDAGAQVDVLARSAFLRYREALGEDIGPIPEGLYPGDYLKQVGAALVETQGAALRNRRGSRLAAARSRRRHPGHDGPDPRRPREPQHSPRGVLLRALADRNRVRTAGRPWPARSTICAARG